MTDDETQDVVEEVDDLLQQALVNANIYKNHDKIRPSALRAFEKVDEARKKLDEIDERDFNDG